MREQIAAYQRKIREAAAARARRAPTATRQVRPRGSRAPERLGELLLSIAVHLAERQNFRSYTFVDDMVSEGVLDCLKACAGFDLSRQSSAFAYLTTCCWYAFGRTIKRERKRGLIAGNDVPLEVFALPSLTLGLFDAQCLSEALRAREASQPTT